MNKYDSPYSISVEETHHNEKLDSPSGTALTLANDIIDKNFDTQALIDIILNTDRELIKDVNIFDVYEGEKIPNDKKSIALNINIQSMHKPLNETNLEKLNNLIIFNVEKKTGAKIRS